MAHPLQAAPGAEVRTLSIESVFSELSGAPRCRRRRAHLLQAAPGAEVRTMSIKSLFSELYGAPAPGGAVR